MAGAGVPVPAEAAESSPKSMRSAVWAAGVPAGVAPAREPASEVGAGASGAAAVIWGVGVSSGGKPRAGGLGEASTGRFRVDTSP